MSTVRDVDILPKSGLIGVLRIIWRKADGIAFAKACTAFLIGVLIFAVLVSSGLAIFVRQV